MESPAQIQAKTREYQAKQLAKLAVDYWIDNEACLPAIESTPRFFLAKRYPKSLPLMNAEAVNIACAEITRLLKEYRLERKGN